MIGYPFGFRILGPVWGRRWIVSAADALAGYAACDPRAQTESESYLSAFWFGDSFRTRLEATGSTAGYRGTCWAPLVWFDIDREGELACALTDARRLAVTLDERYRLRDGDLLAFYSGSKGFHLALPTALWRPEPSSTFNAVCQRFADGIAAQAHVSIDRGVYAQVQAFRAPNSRHPKTGLHKRGLALDELMGLSLAGIQKLAEQPESFELPQIMKTSAQGIADWRDAERAVEQQRAAAAERQAVGNTNLNRATLDFIRDGAHQGDRHRLLFSAAANLAEFGCPAALAHALLTQAGLDCGLRPSDVRRGIDCGLRHGGET